MRRVVVVVILLLALTGCGPYAAAFTPSESMPSAADLAGTWTSDDGATITLTENGAFEVEGVPGSYLPSGDGAGAWAEPEQDPTPFPLIELRYDGGDIAELHHQNGSLLGRENVYFVQGVVDDADWLRLYREN
ncbi:hypothetical protein EYE40_04595 [Glaciihabitans arcticus]|uniref:Lipoprotein n=1 Tax=Glaciihabitans arcticus TaxID=2668039 RepID=A0A4Q9GQ56_9MICO|nr:hypothetical protein [Glaciihabitans arcticus]TBN56735.1 hypothetical protein EYE40_04595 [Glaciihabitans arcticus]